MGLPQQHWGEKDVHGMDIHWLSSKEKVPGVDVSKEGHADSLLGYERTDHYWFPWKRFSMLPIVNSLWWLTIFYIKK